MFHFSNQKKNQKPLAFLGALNVVPVNLVGLRSKGMDPCWFLEKHLYIFMWRSTSVKIATKATDMKRKFISLIVPKLPTIFRDAAAILALIYARQNMWRTHKIDLYCQCFSVLKIHKHVPARCSHDPGILKKRLYLELLQCHSAHVLNHEQFHIYMQQNNIKASNSLQIHLVLEFTGSLADSLDNFFLRRLTLTTILCSRRGIVTFMRRSGLWPAQPSDQANHVLVTFTEPTAFWTKGAHCSERSVESESSNTLEVLHFHALRFVYCIDIKTIDFHLSGCGCSSRLVHPSATAEVKIETPRWNDMKLLKLLESENHWKFP